MIRRLVKIVIVFTFSLSLFGVGYGAVVFSRIRGFATMDEVSRADAIIVMGAAQYNGNPSPVLKARLDHAYKLFDSGFANIVITTGGFGPDPNFSEAHVSTHYLSVLGIDPSQIVTEQGSGTTYDTVQASSRLMHSNGWKKAIVVSDGFHLYRVKEMFADSRVDVLASPAPASPIEMTSTSRIWFSLREIVLLFTYRLVRLVG